MTPDLESPRGLIAAGVLLGALFAAALAAATLVARAVGARAPEAAAPGEAGREGGLHFPVDGIARERLVDGFDEARGVRVHKAIDILAPRNALVRAVDDGTIVRLATNRTGGVTLYQLGASGAYCFYYAHLERYGEGLRAGVRVRRGDVIGYVGSSGNAQTSHLHFAVLLLGRSQDCWSGTAIDPYPLLR